MSGTVDCSHARLAIGGDPRNLSAEVEGHVSGCPACRKFRDEMLAMEGRLEAALQLPLHRFRDAKKSHAPRRYALAASLLIAVLLGGGAWLFQPRPALADQVMEHVRHEAGSWALQRRLAPDEIAAVLARAGVHFDSSMPVVYASPCPFRGHVAPHLVLQTAQGPVTVMLLSHEKIAARESFEEQGYQGVLLPAGEGSVALLTRGGGVPETTEAEILSAVRWQ
ncbi:MAG TPA: DUF3379 family protein [Steroidobacteraceae bacterium]|nr:DUF3379 family protein [Steroidobacteraceae bacterium]